MSPSLVERRKYMQELYGANGQALWLHELGVNVAEKALCRTAAKG